MIPAGGDGSQGGRVMRVPILLLLVALLPGLPAAFAQDEPALLDPPPAPPGAGNADVPPRLPVPDAAAQKEAEKQIRELFKEEYAKRTPEARRELARTLLKNAPSTGGDVAALYVLLREAREAAAAVADLETAMAAADATAARFDVPAAKLKAGTLALARRGARSADQVRLLAAAYLDAANEAVNAADFETAEALAKDAGTVARAARDANAVEEAVTLAKRIADQKREHAELKKAEATLASKPDDPRANLALGRHLCFVKSDWARGLPHLARGSDSALKKAAEMEQAEPQDADGLMEIGDVWYALARKERNALAKGRYARRAIMWYERAKEKSSGVSALKIAKQLEAVYTITSSGGTVPVTKGLVAAWNLNEGRGKKAFDVSGRGLHGEMRNFSSSSWVDGGRLGAVSLEFDGRDDYIKVDRDAAWNAIDRQFTFAAWIHKNPVEREFMAIASRQVGDGMRESLFFGFGEGRLACFFHLEDREEPRGIEERAPFPTGKWIHVAVTCDGNTLRLFRDGKVTATDEYEGGKLRDEKNPMIIGGNEDGPEDIARGGLFFGKIARLRIYDRALKGSEIESLAKYDR